MVYKLKPGSHIKADAQVAGEMCERLASENRLTAKVLVDENRPVDAPLHDEFEWDDAIAAEAYREEQARHIIQCIIKVEEDVAPVRAFFNIEKASPEYKHIDVILKTEDDTTKLLKTAFGELRAFQKKYARLQQLTPVFKAIDKLALDLDMAGT